MYSVLQPAVSFLFGRWVQVGPAARPCSVHLLFHSKRPFRNPLHQSSMLSLDSRCHGTGNWCIAVDQSLLQPISKCPQSRPFRHHHAHCCVAYLVAGAFGQVDLVSIPVSGERKLLVRKMLVPGSSRSSLDGTATQAAVPKVRRSSAQGEAQQCPR
jgi:hypothetical protein